MSKFELVIKGVGRFVINEFKMQTAYGYSNNERPIYDFKIQHQNMVDTELMLNLMQKYKDYLFSFIEFQEKGVTVLHSFRGVITQISSGSLYNQGYSLSLTFSIMALTNPTREVKTKEKTKVDMVRDRLLEASGKL